MRLYKCLNTTLDLDHVLAVTDIREREWDFSVVLALRDKPLDFSCYLHARDDSNGYDLEKLKQARTDLITAWSSPSPQCTFSWQPVSGGESIRCKLPINHIGNHEV